MFQYFYEFVRHTQRAHIDFGMSHSKWTGIVSQCQALCYAIKYWINDNDMPCNQNYFLLHFLLAMAIHSKLFISSAFLGKVIRFQVLKLGVLCDQAFDIFHSHVLHRNISNIVYYDIRVSTWRMAVFLVIIIDDSFSYFQMLGCNIFLQKIDIILLFDGRFISGQ